MTEFDDRVILRLKSSLPELSNIETVTNIWWFHDGKWAPPGFSNYGTSYLTLTNYNDDPPSTPLNLFAITTTGTEGEPLLAIDRGLVVQKDIAAGGYISANQGELWLGSGRDDQVDVPKIILGNASCSRLGGGGVYAIEPVPSSGTTFPVGEKGKVAIRTDAWNGNPQNTLYKHNGTTWIPMGPTSNYAGNFDTLYLRKMLIIDNQKDVNTPAHLDLGNLTVQGSLTFNTSGDSSNAVTLHSGYNSSTEKYLYPSDAYVGLGSVGRPFLYVDTTYLYADNLKGFTGSTINVLNTLAFGNYPFTITSTNTIANLNADLLDGHHANEFLTAQWNGGTVTGNITIQKNSPSLDLKSTTGEPVIFLSRYGEPRYVTFGLTTDYGGVGDSEEVYLDYTGTGGVRIWSYPYNSGEFRIYHKTAIVGNLSLSGGLIAGGDTVISHPGPVFFNVNSASNDSAVINLAQGGSTKGFFGTDGNRVYLNTSNGLPLHLESSSGVIYALNDFVIQGDVQISKSNPAFNLVHSGAIRGMFGYNSGTGRTYINSGQSAPLELNSASGSIYLNSHMRGNSGGISIYPYSNGNGNIGGDGSSGYPYWGAVFAGYLKYKNPPSAFDSLDDLALIANYKTKTELQTHPLTGQTVEVEVVDVENSLPHLLDQDGFHDASRDVGFLLGCMKFEVLARQKTDSEVSRLHSQIQTLQTQINELKRGGVSS
jgi:hypothetical protein